MVDTLTFYFDFASPYGYFAATRIDALAAEFDLEAKWRPFLMWALVKKSGIAIPMEAPARRAYFVQDIARSAAFYGLPYKLPPKFGAISSHLAARLYYHVAAHDPARAKDLAGLIFRGYLEQGRDISDRAALSAIAAGAMHASEIEAALEGDPGRNALERAVEDAVADGVIGSPFVVIGDQGFFGVDRLPQIRWYLERGGHAGS